MDTDDLTPMAYECIVSAYCVVDLLAIELGAAANNYPNEEEYLKGILTFVTVIESDPMNYLQNWNLEEIDVEIFKENVMKVKKQIMQTIETPFSDRGPLIDW